MPQSQYRARQVGAKTHEVIEYDHDETKPGKPLHILVPGGLVALASLGVIVLVIYLTWFEGRLDQNTGIVLAAILFPFYVGGVFLFSYGYELLTARIAEDRTCLRITIMPVPHAARRRRRS